MQNQILFDTPNATAQKTFKYLGYTFTPVRQFTEKENALGLRLPISHLDKPRLNVNGKDNQFNHDDFYKAAKTANADQIDIFEMADETLVIPCSYTLQEYKIEDLEEYLETFKRFLNK